MATRLQLLVIGTATTLLTSAGTYISSHWGGVTSEQLAQTEQRLGVLVNKVEMKVTSESTRLQVYVDEKVASAEERLAKAPKKRKVKSEQ